MFNRVPDGAAEAAPLQRTIFETRSNNYGSDTYPCLPVGARWHDFRQMLAFWVYRIVAANLGIAGLRGFKHRASGEPWVRRTVGIQIPSPAGCVSRRRLNVPEKSAGVEYQSNRGRHCTQIGAENRGTNPGHQAVETNTRSSFACILPRIRIETDVVGQRSTRPWGLFPAQQLH